MDANSPYQDLLGRIDYPSNDLTLGQLVKRFPEDFAGVSMIGKGFHNSRSPVSAALIDLLETEREIAAEIIASCRNEPGDFLPYCDSSREDRTKQLKMMYVDLGRAAGIHQASELTKSLERQAEKMADCRTP
ncbi:hypothetical protein [Rhodopirellula bahusiensis]|uniref:hypothetical protein n=1 Tax=Rhodopirellula bahusiensis TaxID=2014065 RepID=UPI0032669B70